MKARRIMSALLALVLMLSLCPQTELFANAATLETAQEFVFQSKVYTGSDSLIKMEGIPDYRMANVIEGTSDKWEVTDTRYIDDVRIGYESWGGIYNGAYFQLATRRASGDACINFALDMKKGENLKPELTYYGFEFSPKLDVYLIPQATLDAHKPTMTHSVSGSAKTILYIDSLNASGNEAERAKYFLGSFDAYKDAGDTGEKATAILSDITVPEDGTYYLVLHAVGTNDAYAARNGSYAGVAITGLAFKREKKETPAPTAQKQKFVFQSKVYTGSDSLIKMENIPGYRMANVIDGTSAKWEVTDTRYIDDVRIGYESWGGVYNGAYFQLATRRTNGDACINFALDLKKGENLVPELTYYGFEFSPVVDVFLVPQAVLDAHKPTMAHSVSGSAKTILYIDSLNASGNEAERAKYYLGSVDTWKDAGDTGEKASVTFDPITIEEDGVYYFVLQTVGKNEKYAARGGSSAGVAITGLTFEAKETPVPVAEPQNYVFQSAVYTGSNSLIKMENIPSYRMANVIDGTSDKWEVTDTRYIDDVRIGYESWGGIYNGAYFQTATRRASGDACINFALDMKKGEDLTVKLTYYGFEFSPIVDLYLIPQATLDAHKPTMAHSVSGSAKTILYIDNLNASGNEAEKAKYYIGTVDTYKNAGDTGEKASASFDGVTIPEDGVYYFVLHTVGTNEAYAARNGSYAGVALTELSLTGKSAEPPAPKDELTAIKITASEKELEVGGKTTFTVSGTYFLSGNKTITDGITFESSDSSIVKVKGNEAEALAEGSAEITATVAGLSDKVTIKVTPYDPGNAGVIREYRMGWDSLQLSKLPKTNDSSLYNDGTYTRSGTIFMNSKLMNRNATAALNANAESVPEWRLMDFDVTAPWDMAYERSQGGVRIMKADDEMLLNYTVANYGASSGTILALRLEVPNKGTYNLSIENNYSQYGINPAVYFFRDDGTIGNSSDVYNHIKSIQPVCYYSFSDKTQKGYTKIAEVEAPRRGDYFIVFYCDEHSKELNPNVTVSGGRSYQELHLKGIRLAALPGELAKVDMEIESLRTEADPMPLLTEKKISFALSDALDIPIDEIDEDKLTVTYDSSDKTVATVSEDGVVSALANGNAEITVNVNYDGASASDKWDLIVAPAGRNLAEHLNPKFDTDEWIWMGADNMPNPPSTPVFSRGYIATEESGNRALRFDFNPEMGAEDTTIFFKNDGHRVPVTPGKFYQLVFKFKTDYTVPAGASEFNMFFDVYAFANPTGTSSSAEAYSANRAMNLTGHPQFRELYSDWYEVVVPVAAPSEYAADVVYLTPRLVMRPASGDSGKLGYSGSAWFDDFELREVGYAGVEVSYSGNKEGSSEITVEAKPYTTLGHYISIGDKWGTDQAKLSCTDENVIKEFKNLKIAKDSLGNCWLGATASLGGKNATADIVSAIELNGITREGRAEITTSGFAMKLLYASAVSEPQSVEVGDTAKVIPTGYMTDGTVADISGATVTYVSLTPETVGVDSEGNIIPKKMGSGKIKTIITLGGSTVSAVADVRITDSSKIASATLAECASVGYLRDEELVIDGVMESGYPADISAADIEWVIESDPVGGVSVDENRRIFGEIFGARATVSAKVTLNGATVETNAIEIEVAETDLRDFTIRFIDAHPTKPNKVTIEEFGWEIVPDKSHSSAVGGNFETSGFIVPTKSAGQALTIAVDIPYEGAYQIVFRGQYNNYNAHDGEIYCDGLHIGTAQYWNEGLNKAAEPLHLRSLYLTKGRHEFTFVSGERATLGAQQMLQELRFRALAELPDISDIITEKDKYNLVVGDKASLNAALVTADGYTYNWQKMLDGGNDKLASIAYESTDAAVVKVDETGVITAVKNGEASIRLIAKSGEKTFEKLVPINVDGSDINVATLATDRRIFYITEEIKLGVHATLASGAVLDPSKMTVTWKSSDENIVSFAADGTMTAKAEGSATITATIAYYNEPPFEATADITVEPDGFASVEIDAARFVLSPDGDEEALSARAVTGLGKDVDMTGASVAWESDNENVAIISDGGIVTSGAEGSATITATVTISGETVSGNAMISVRAGKVARTYYTDAMVEAAQENVQKYAWAKKLKENAVKEADRYLDKLDIIYEMIPGEGLPRGAAVGYRSDPDKYYCRYCGEYLYDRFGDCPFVVNVLTDPWKTQCPSCKRKFPSNDFAKLYELGRNEHGIYEIALAEERNAALVEESDGKIDYMKNTLYPELYDETKESFNKDPRTGQTVDGLRWGVDTGLGYDTGRTYSNGTREIHTYIGYIMHCGVWTDTAGSGKTGLIRMSLNNLASAYMYTGDMKYGRAGAIIIDRVADVYPGYDLRPYLTRFDNSDGGARRGKVVGSIWETFLSQSLVAAYDAFFPAFDDPQVVAYLSEKAEKYNLENDKSTPEKIRQNCENGILREVYEAVKDSSIAGNFGMHQNSCAMAAVVLDNHPETDEMIDWIYHYSETDNTSYNTGGGITQTLIDNVNRDGQGTESAFGYNRLWVTQLTDVADTLARYPEYTGMSLYEHPKYVGMIQSYPYVTLVRRGTPAIGDGGTVGGYALLPDNDDVMIQSFKYMKNIDYAKAVEIAQHMYFVKGSDLDNLHYDIWTKNPENLKAEVDAIIEKYGEWNYDKSSMLTGYGIGILRSGTLHKATGSSAFRDTQRDFWIYFGGATSHYNNDALSLGIEAYGIGMTTDLGYPEATGHDPNRSQWMSPTIAHNAVVVNEQSQIRSAYPQVPLHYDAKDTRVKVLDVDGTPSYTVTDEYRRTVVMVDYDSDVSYGIDFFKVRGGEDHIYSFHASTDIHPTSSLTFEQQIGGTYAGADVPFGNDPWTTVGNNYTLLKYPTGYSWLFDIHKAEKPGTGNFWIDYNIKDFRKLSRNPNMDIHLRVTAVNDWNADEVTLANGMPPRKPQNLSVMDHLEYMLVRRKGRDLNTLFTTVFEPYNGERYIRSIENVSVEAIEGTPGKFDDAKAVKVELIDGRCDYIVYAQNKNVTYRVADLFDFKGFVGVWTVNEDGNNIYTYVNDGEMIGNETEKVEGLTAALEGTVVDFQRDLSFDNWIDVRFDREVTAEEVASLADRMFVQERERLGNSSFVILAAEKTGADTARLDLGGITPIARYKDAKNEDFGYEYDIDSGAHFAIPMSYEDNQAPIFDSVSDKLSVNAGSSISVRVNARAQDSDAGVMYSERQLPRGASFDSETATVTWKPANSQIGKGLFAIDATDEYGRTSTVYFTVEVFGSTGNSGGGAGGGGGSSASSASGTSTPTIPATKPEDKKDEKDNTSSSTDNVGDGVLDVPQNPGTDNSDENVRFVDLGNHAWAADAINALADEGIIKGTSENTFSPAANITRADFAILLVRAFKLASESEENFADVSASDYFAKELAVARNTGLVNGIGENKFAPRNNITRQDMMVIVYRALNSMEKFVGAIHESPANPDFNDVADYAKDAVSALVNAKLISGKNGLIDPTANTTRAEVAVLIQRILDFVK